MENKTKAIIVAVIVVIILVIAIIFKIKSDRKRKSLTIYSIKMDKDVYSDKIASQGKKPNLWGIPSWGLALLTMILAFVVLMVLGDFIGAIFRMQESGFVKVLQ